MKRSCSLNKIIFELYDVFKVFDDYYFIILLDEKDFYCLSIFPFTLLSIPLIHLHSKNLRTLYQKSLAVLRKIITNRYIIREKNYIILYTSPEIGEALLLYYIAYFTARKIETNILEKMLMTGIKAELLDIRNRMIEETYISTTNRQLEALIDQQIITKYSNIIRKKLKQLYKN